MRNIFEKDIDVIELQPIELSTMEICGIGKIQIMNTGGTEASEGGMGSGDKDKKEKGELTKQGNKTDNSSENDENKSFDPVGKEIKEKEKERK